MVRKLVTPGEIRQAEIAFDRVYQSADPFDSPFRDDWPDRALLFPAPRDLSDEQWSAVTAAAHIIHERKAYFSEIESYKGANFEHHLHWRINLSESNINLLLHQQGWSGISESALYSVNGLWGALTSHELHAVIAGQPEFMAALGKELDLDAELDEFLRYWQSAHHDWKARIGWIPGLLNHIYGPDRAQAYLAHYGLDLPEGQEGAGI